MEFDVRMPKLMEWQQPVFADVTNDCGKGMTYCVKAKRQVGKSILAESLLIYFAVRNERSIGTMIEPTLKQCRRVWKQLLTAIGGEKSPLVKSANQTLLIIELVNGSEIVFQSAEQGEALRGMTVKKSLLVIDEGAYIKDDIYNILYPITDALSCPILLISTPLFCSGEFYERYTEGLSYDCNRPHQHCKSYDWAKYDTSIFLPPHKLEHYRQTLPELKFRSDYLGEFITEGSYLFGTIKTKPYSTKPPRYLGVDWSAGEDNDYTVATFMDDDANVTHILHWKDFDATDLVTELANAIASCRTLERVLIEKNSIGKVYGDMLKKELKGRTKQGLVDFFITSLDSKRRIIEELVKAVQTDKIGVPDDRELLAEMQHYSAEKTPGGKMTYNGGDGYHDDYVLSLAFALEAKRQGAKTALSITFA